MNKRLVIYEVLVWVLSILVGLSLTMFLFQVFGGLNV